MPQQAAQTAAEWVMVARSVAQLPDGQPMALRSLSRAEVLAETAADWVGVAVVWQQDFSDPEMARQCMGKAEAAAYDSADWDRVAGFWLAAGNSPQANECYKKAIGRVGYGDDKNSVYWVKEAQRQIRHNYSRAIAGMMIAEEVAEKFGDWLIIAGFWKEKFQDYDNGLRCMRYADAGSDSDGWLRIALAWKDKFQNYGRAVWCMKQAEEWVRGDRGKSAQDWLAVLDCWKDDFDDPENYERCLDMAQDELSEFDFYDIVEGGARAYLTARTEPAAVNLGQSLDIAKPLSSTKTESGTWGADLLSPHREGSYARFYNFTLDSSAEVTIELASRIDTYLYLLAAAFDDEVVEDVLEENDDWPDADADGLSSTDSRIQCRLDAGTYIIEATTYEATETGDFTLQISRRDVPANRQDARWHPDLAVADLGVLPDIPLVYTETWSDDCVSKNRAGCYARYCNFILPADAEVTIDLTSHADAYLYLIGGDSIDGEVLDENDDNEDMDGGNDSRIRRRLEAGTYTIEATTYGAEETGDFTLVISLRN